MGCQPYIEAFEATNFHHKNDKLNIESLDFFHQQISCHLTFKSIFLQSLQPIALELGLN